MGEMDGETPRAAVEHGSFGVLDILRRERVGGGAGYGACCGPGFCEGILECSVAR